MSRIAAGNADLLITGGGIVGAGVARDAALRGLSVILVEQSDFASGTSSRSSRLLHGGLRYLAQGHIGLVREASLEKMRLSCLAPHLCRPLRFALPVWKGDAWPRWKLAVGVRAYDLLCGGRNLGRSAGHSADEMARRLPGLRWHGLTGGVSYFDALTNDARLVIDTLRSAGRAGASLYNYARLLSAEPTASGWNCEIEDRATGERVRVRAGAVVNATGPWSHKFLYSSVRLRLTKGVHLVVDRSRLPLESAVVLSEGTRILFVIPWEERVILGTTDTDYTEDPAQVRTEAEDVDYILRVVNRGFPQAHLEAADVIASWAGVRPLIAAPGNSAGAPSDISRTHEIRTPQPGWVDVAGGKLTTYRLIAEQVVDRIAAHLGMPVARSTTAHRPLAESADQVRYSGVVPPRLSADVVRHCCEHEWVRHLDDLMLRRTSWHYYHREQHEMAERASRWMAPCVGWAESERLAELDRYAAAAEFSPTPQLSRTRRQ